MSLLQFGAERDPSTSTIIGSDLSFSGRRNIQRDSRPLRIMWLSTLEVTIVNSYWPYCKFGNLRKKTSSWDQETTWTRSDSCGWITGLNEESPFMLRKVNRRWPVYPYLRAWELAWGIEPEVTILKIVRGRKIFTHAFFTAKIWADSAL